MISRFEVSHLVNDALKHKIKSLHPYTFCLNLDPGFDMYTSMHDLTAVAHNAIDSQDMILLKQCINVAERLHKEGDHLVQGIVENVFIYELSSRVSKDVWPRAFYNLYLKQIMSSN